MIAIINAICLDHQANAAVHNAFYVDRFLAVAYASIGKMVGLIRWGGSKCCQVSLDCV
ncbi:protein of unknown function (plasmid) [Agrobacterium pusense]|uniref:Uncharacterized protein n=1 Tax=Agrobacterium pusense TaxID=648995 RepID=U4Q534_9HYPH|nr:protein of unknown function [Agrobacterium pusense]